MERYSIKVVAFYTKDTPYANIIKRLKSSLIKYGVDFYIKGYPSLQSWEENCGIKPTFIKHCLEKFDSDIFYVDADAEFIKPPNFMEFKGTVDPKFVFIKWDTPSKSWYELLSGSIYLPNNEQSIKIVNRWVEEQKVYPQRWDQLTLQAILPSILDNINILEYKWCYVLPHMKDFNIEPIIIHHQASREFKGIINS